MIVEHRPGSLYELARVLEKDQAQVLRDARTLEALGLIQLESVREGRREKLKPKARYDRIMFEFQSRKAAKTG